MADEEVAKKIERAKQILRHKYPQGKLEDIFNEALELLLEKKDPERKMTKSHPERKRGIYSIEKKQFESKPNIIRPKSPSHPVSRYIPQNLKLEIYKRDNGQCSYVSKEGKPCQEKNFLEMDHVKPWALGGRSTKDNLQLLCVSHNKLRAEKTFGFQWREE